MLHGKPPSSRFSFSLILLLLLVDLLPSKLFASNSLLIVVDEDDDEVDNEHAACEYSSLIPSNFNP